jgi:AcrR family transcriptional regulator
MENTATKAKAEAISPSKIQGKQRILAAAQYCYERDGIKKTNINDIAKQAKITRRTVYRYFSSHDEIILEVFEHVIDGFWQSLSDSVITTQSFGETIVDALLFSIQYANNTERNAFMFAPEVQAITNRAFLNPRFTQATYEGLDKIYRLKLEQNLAKQGLDLLMLAEWFNRLVLSFLNTPSEHFTNEKKLRALFQAMLAPALQ